MNFRKTAIAAATAGALAAGSLAAPTQANAYPAWVIPAIIAAGVGGLVVGGVTTTSYAHERGNIYARPMGGCWIENRRSGPVEVCRR